MPIPTEPVGSLPRPAKLQGALANYDAPTITKEQLKVEQDAAFRDSILKMEATGSPIVSDGEQRASSFATYPPSDTRAGTGLAENLAGDGQYFAIFTDGGPPGAIAAAASTTAAGAPFIAAASAERGGIVPNAITSAILHPNEMVLPAPLSQGFQRMLGTGGGGSAGNTHLHYSPTVHAYGAGGWKTCGRVTLPP